MERGEEEPKDAKLVKSILKSMGVQQHEPRVVHQFLDFWYRYVVEVLTDAQVFSEHAGKTIIDCEDVNLAIQTRVNHSFSQPPPRETLMELARIRNSTPLPTSVGGPGIALPPERDTLIAPNYQLLVATRTSHFVDEEMEFDEEENNEAEADAEKRSSVPATLQKSDQDGGRKVSFAVAGNRSKG
eukprot:c23803_g1_i2 orf=112-666(+)